MSQEMMEMLGQLAKTTEVKAAAEKADQVETKAAELSAELAEMKSAREQDALRIKDLEAKASAPKADAPVEVKSIGEQFVESAEFGAYSEAKSKVARVEVKATPTTNTEANTYSQRLAGIVQKPTESLTILAAIPNASASSNSIDYVKENAWVNGAAPQAGEGAVKGESTFTTETVNTPVETIAHWTKMSKQMMEDNTAMVSFINQRMPHGVEKKINAQIISGSGASNELKGLTHTDNHTVYTAGAGSSMIDNLRLALADLEVFEHMPSFFVMHPKDVAALDLSAGTDGHFIAANARTYNAPTIWGVPIVKSQQIAEGKFMLIDSSQVTLWMRNSLALETTQFDQDDFTKNLVTVRAEQRCALTVYNKTGVIYGDLEGA